MRSGGFWRKPSPWVWTVFGLSMLLFFVSMATWREGRRFVSRRLEPKEARVVGEAMKLWSEIPGVERVEGCRSLVNSGELRVMHALTFVRAQERATFGYTSEHGRILLNPAICFASQRMSGLERPTESDIVATLATLYHEMQHLRYGASEEAAYEAEWHLVRCARAWASDQGRASLSQAFSVWEEEMPERVRLTLGQESVDRVQARQLALSLSSPELSRSR